MVLGAECSDASVCCEDIASCQQIKKWDDENRCCVPQDEPCNIVFTCCGNTYCDINDSGKCKPIPPTENPSPQPTNKPTVAPNTPNPTMQPTDAPTATPTKSLRFYIIFSIS